MSTLPAAAATGILSVLTTVAAFTVWARIRYARRLSFFRCRLGSPTGGRRRRRARWRLRRSWATWVGDVLLVRSGALRLWLTPLPVGVARDVTVEALESGEVRGLGRRPVALRFTVGGAREFEIAVAAEMADASRRTLPDRSPVRTARRAPGARRLMPPVIPPG